MRRFRTEGTMREQSRRGAPDKKPQRNTAAVVKLAAAAGVKSIKPIPSDLGDSGELAAEPVLVLRGKWHRNLEIFDGRGKRIGEAVGPDPKGRRRATEQPLVYTFSDSEERFELRFPTAPRPKSRDVKHRLPPRHPSSAFELRDIAHEEQATLWLADYVGAEPHARLPGLLRGEIEQNHETIARFDPCPREEMRARVSRWSGNTEWRVVRNGDVEVARVAFLRRRNIGYIAKYLAQIHHVNYVIVIARDAQPIERRAAIGLCVIADNYYVDFWEPG